MISLTVHSPKCLYFWESERFSGYFSFCIEEPEAHFPLQCPGQELQAACASFSLWTQQEAGIGAFQLESVSWTDFHVLQGLSQGQLDVFLPWSESSIQSQRKETEDLAGTFCHCNQCKPEVEVETVWFTLCHESYKKSSFCTKGCVGICWYSCTLFAILVAGLLSYSKGSSVKEEQSDPAD